MTDRLGFVICTALLTGFAQASPVTYAYYGNPFAGNNGVNIYSSASPPYTAADRITGEITFSSPLPADVGLTNVGGLVGFPGLVMAFDFTDGVQTDLFSCIDPLSHSSACEITIAPGSFYVATDNSGNIVSWNLILSGMQIQNDYFVGSLPTDAGSSGGGTGFNINEPGYWVLEPNGPIPEDPVPESGTWMLSLFGLAFIRVRLAER